MIDAILLAITLCVSISIYASNIPLDGSNLKKNQEYVCTRWIGSADYTQRRPSVCIFWEIKEKPLHKRV